MKNGHISEVSVSMSNKKYYIFILSFLLFITLTSGVNGLEENKIKQADNLVSLEEMSIQERIDFLNQKINEKNLSWVAGETSMSQLSKDETKRMLGYVRNETDKLNTKQSQLTSLGTPPSSVDWRDKNGNWVTPVKNQGFCGYCWVFSSVAVVESRAKIDLNNPSYIIDLSEQDVASCAPESNGGICDDDTDGNDEINALSYMKNTGIIKESCFPYSGSANECSNKCSNWQNEIMKISNYNSVSGITSIKQAINDYGPVTVYMYVDDDFINYYSGGVYSHTLVTWTGGLHSISIVGYNDADQYWICKNSWGTGWGEKGYFKIAYSENVLDFDAWDNDPDDNRTFFLDDSYCVTGTDIGTIPTVNSAQANITYANSTTPINFTVYAKANSIKQLLSVKINGTSMSGTLSTGGTFSTIKTLSDFGCQDFEGNCVLTINATDDAGKANTSEKITVVVDDIAPRVTANPTFYPDNQNAARNGSLITLNASISDTGAGVKNATVNVSQINSSFGDIQLTNINGFWINDSVIVMAPDGTYFLNITAYDNAGNMNGAVNLSVKVDNIYPVINTVTLNTSTPNVGDDILVTVNVTDNMDVTSVEANGIALTCQSGDVWEGSVIAKEDFHIIYVKAIDTAGLISRNFSLTYFANNTPIGTNVQVAIPEIGASLTFANVTKSGQTFVSALKADPSPPTGFDTLSDYHNIMTTAEYTGNITICIDYTESDADNENYIKILHYGENEDKNEIFALMQENISVVDTVWDFNGTTYPDILCEGSLENLHFVIDGTRLEMNWSNFVYNTSIYDKNGEPFIAWLDEPMFVIESGSNWYLSKMLINETHEDTYSLVVDNTMHLLEGFAITLNDIDVEGDEAWISITKDGEKVESSVVKEGEQFIYEEDLNGSGDDDNWVLKFYLENVSLDSNSIKINKTQLISPNFTIIDTPNDDTISNFTIRSINANTLQIELDGDENISIEKGGVVNLIGDKFRFKLDENGNTGGVLKRPELTGLWKDVTSSLYTDTNIICGVVTNLSDFVIVDTTPPSNNGNGNGGSSSSGGGASGEDFYNIVISETDRQSVYKNSSISYIFDLDGNIVRHINFTALNSAGKVAAKVEILNNTSTLVSTPPPHEVFKNLNIWVGNAGWATARNIADATVVFTVEKSWITGNNIDESSIALYHYRDDTWHELVTRKIAEDANSLQFEAETTGFSPFAVSGKKTMGETGGEGIIEPTVTAEKTPASTPTEEKGMPGFGLFAGLSILLIAVQLLHKNK